MKSALRSAYVETYGCSANQSHSEAIKGSLAHNGIAISPDASKADAIILNTCIVKKPTENKTRERIRAIVRRYPGKPLVITGCAADVGMFREAAPHALYLPSSKTGEIARLLLGNARPAGRKMRTNPHVGITEISSGCVGKCAYCIVRLAKCALISRTMDEVVKDVRCSLNDGCREIWITSQDNSCYGLDINANLAQLLGRVVALKGDFRVRVGMMNPAHMKPFLRDLIEVYKSPKVYKFIHVPVQSGSDKVLEPMKRGYTSSDFEGIVAAFRGSFPDVTLSTDIIVGFPGETESDFKATLSLVRRIRPDIVNVSRFGPRPGTEAARMGQLDNKLVKRRSGGLACLARSIGLEKNKEWIGRECLVLFTERGKRKNQFAGRNECYKPVVVASEKDLLGRFLKVKITECGQSALAAKIKRFQA